MQKNVYMTDEKYTMAIGIGSVVLHVVQPQRTGKITVTNVLHTPELSANLLSVSCLTTKGASVEFKAMTCNVYNVEGNCLAVAKKTGSFFNLQLAKPESEVNVAVAKATMDVWHRRLAHLGESNVRKLVTSSTGIELEPDGLEDHASLCQGCALKKQTKSVSRQPQWRATEQLKLLHTDVGGPITPISLGGARFYVTFTDNYSRATWFYTMKTKAECLEKMKECVQLLETGTGLKVKRIRWRNGGEYSSTACKTFYKEKGIQWKPTVPYAPEQDGVAERVNRTILDRLRTILSDTGLQKDLWAEILSTVVYLKNRSPMTANKEGKTPFEMWYGRKPALEHLRVVGCPAYYHLPKTGQKKLDPRGQKAVFIGYEGSNQYRLWDEDKHSIIRSRDVLFDEDKMSPVLETEPEQQDAVIETIPVFELGSVLKARGWEEGEEAYRS
jgi:hypothetical protein